MTPEKLTLGTRRSELALTQAKMVAAALEANHPGLTVELQEIVTSGDKILDAPLAKIGDKGLFVKELENALLDGGIDLAVHSAKDLPTGIPDGLMLAAFTPREDPRDVFIGNAARLAELRRRARVGTGSLRRRSQLLSTRPDIEVVEIRGNVDTRIRKIEEMGLDGTILAAAGLRRLGREEEASFCFQVREMVPAVGQGVLAIETRRDDTRVLEAVGSLNDDYASAAVRAERALMARLEGGCQVPVGANASIWQGEIVMYAYLGSVDGSRHVQDRIHGPLDRAEALGTELAERMLADGGEEILAEIRT